MRLQIRKKDEVFRECLRGLVRRSYHKSGADLITDRRQIIEASLALRKLHSRRMQTRVMFLVRGLVPKQIPIRPRLKIADIRIMRFLSDRQSDRGIGEILANMTDYLNKSIIGKIRILPPLQDEGVIPEFLPVCATSENLLFREPIPADIFRFRVNAAVITSVFAVVGEFDQSAEKNTVAVCGATHVVRGFAERLKNRVGQVLRKQGGNDVG